MSKFPFKNVRKLNFHPWILYMKLCSIQCVWWVYYLQKPLGLDQFQIHLLLGLFTWRYSIKLTAPFHTVSRSGMCVELYLCNPAWIQATLLAARVTLHLPSILKYQTFFVKVRLFLYLPWNLAVHAGEWSASHPGCFAPGIYTPVPIQ